MGPFHALDDFPGIASVGGDGGSRVTASADRVNFAFVFVDDVHGETARLVVDFIMSHMGEGRRLDGRAPVPAVPDADGAVVYDCSRQQATVFARALTYASAEPMGPALPDAVLGSTALGVLLSHAFAAFSRDYESKIARRAEAPSLGVWSNVLRVVADDGVSQRDMPKLAVLSRRGLRGVLRDVERLGWVSAVKRGRDRQLRPTPIGRRVRDSGRAFVAEVEADWHRDSGSRLRTLREALAALVCQLDIELPWCLTGYGAADESVTGGDYIAADVGPPRVPHHGQDWPVVLRDATTDASALPLSALLSQALAAFTIDFEWDIRGYGAGLSATSNLLQFVGDDGIPVGQASQLGEVDGSGKAGLERHLVAVVVPGERRDRTRRVYLTPKGKRARDSYPCRVMAVERDWRSRYGSCVDTLRRALEALAGDFGDDLPNYPPTTEWFYHSMRAGSAAMRTGAAKPVPR